MTITIRLWHIIVAVIIIILLFFYNGCGKQEKINELTALNKALSDTLKITRDKNGALHGEIDILETQQIDDFLALNLKDSLNKQLQLELARNKKALTHGGSVTVINTSTNVDTVVEGVSLTGRDTIIQNDTVFVYPEYSRTIDQYGEWINGYVRINKDSLALSLKMKHSYSVTLGREKVSLFKSKPVAFITSYNPYDSLEGFRTYQVTVPKPKTVQKVGAGLVVGFVLGFLIAK